MFKSTTQIALFKGLIAATRDERLSIDEAVKRTNKIDWNISSDTWTNVLVSPNGRMARAQQAKNLGGKLIAYFIAANKMTEEEIETIRREYNNAHGINLNEDNVEPISLPKPVEDVIYEQ